MNEFMARYKYEKIQSLAPAAGQAESLRDD